MIPFRAFLIRLFALVAAAVSPIHAEPIKAGENGKIRIACVGDSITQGVGAEKGMSYPSQLQELLGDRYEVGNFGVSGRTLLRKGDHPYWQEKAFQQAQDFRPAAVIIMLGTNDTKPENWVHEDEFAADYRDLVKTFQALPSRPQVWVCRPVPVPEPGNFGINETNIQREIPQIDQVAKEEKAAVLDMHAALLPRSELFPDRVHPNNAGALALAEAAYQALTGRPLPVRPNPLFASNAVLQRDQPLPVWGTAADGQKVTVEFAGQKVAATAKGGRWMVQLKAMPANATPQEMTITGDRTLKLTNLLIGDVWLCSGQSNMERQLGPRRGQPEITDWQQEVAAANHPLIRHFLASQTLAPAPAATVPGKWEVCSPETVANFTAVGYFFARDLQEKIKVPIGILHSSWGGTVAEAWTPRAAQESRPELRGYVENSDKGIADYPRKVAEFQKNAPELMKKFEADAAQAKLEGKPAPRRPSPPNDPHFGNGQPGVIYHGMIAPLVPYSIRGVVWYQGESNQKRGKAYRTLLPALIESWRKDWRNDFPFLIVQIAPSSAWDPAIREAQLMTWKSTPKTAMIVTTDIGSTNQHPPHKQIVGERLALAARAVAYGEKVEYSGPVFDRAEYQGNKAILHFTHGDGGLKTSDGAALKGFEISGDGKMFVPAQATIEGETVAVTSPQVPVPKSVRYGWSGAPDVNLASKPGLPASPFRTDPD